MRRISSSRIAEFGFCNLTWKHRENGVEPSNPERLASGLAYHKSIGRSIRDVGLLEGSSRLSRKAAILFIILSFLIGGVLWLLL